MIHEKLITSAKAGDNNAFNFLYEEHREMIYRLAYKLSGSNENAEEIMQETFIKAFKNISSLSTNSMDSFKYWIIRICVNTSISHLRKMKTRKNTFVLESIENPENYLSSEPNQEAGIHIDEIREIIDRTVETLSTKQKIIFNLRYNHDMKIKKIANILNISEGNIKSQLYRAVSKLKKQLAPIMEEI